MADKTNDEKEGEQMIERTADVLVARPAVLTRDLREQAAGLRTIIPPAGPPGIQRDATKERPMEDQTNINAQLRELVSDWRSYAIWAAEQARDGNSDPTLRTAAAVYFRTSSELETILDLATGDRAFPDERAPIGLSMRATIVFGIDLDSDDHMLSHRGIESEICAWLHSLRCTVFAVSVRNNDKAAQS